MASWYAVYEEASGRLESVGTVVGEPAALPAGWVALALDAAPDLRTQMWNAAVRAFVPRPAKVLVDRLTDLRGHPDFSTVWSGLSTTQRNGLITAVLWLLGRSRYRNPGETPGIGGAA